MKKHAVQLFFTICFLFSCNTNKKNEYSSEATQNFMNSCVENGATQEMCGCLLDKIQVKYTFEEFSSIEVRIMSGKTPTDFLDFVGKSRAECIKRK
jgi:hypothetical protein